MPNHKHIYAHDASTYQSMISKQPSMEPVIEEICPYSDLDIVDLGAGTGRLAAELAGKARSIVAVDGSEAMLRIAAERLQRTGQSNWRTVIADLRELPLADDSADLIVAGWSLCYLTNDGVPGWASNLERIMLEMRRVLRKNSTLIVFETMGTGCETPHPPDDLKPYYAKLTERYGFTHRWLRTDYTFDNALQAEKLTRFFFGSPLADRVRREKLVQVPECAGIWFKRF